MTSCNVPSERLAWLAGMHLDEAVGREGGRVEGCAVGALRAQGGGGSAGMYTPADSGALMAGVKARSQHCLQTRGSFRG